MEEERFAERDVRVFDDFAAMLDATSSDWIAIATPIGLHAAMHAACVERRIPCYLEKPPTLDPAELESMIAVDGQARQATQVGFNYVYEPERLALKGRILGGEFGALRQVSVLGAWARPLAYYARSNWAGRLFLGDTLLLDSCMGNAMSHHVHNVLFFAGRTMDSWGGCRSVKARLFRANAIQGADTVFLRGELEGAVEVRLALSHACESVSLTEERILCEKADIRIIPRKFIEIRREEGSVEMIPFSERENLLENFRIFNDFVRIGNGRGLSTLAHCRPFVQLNALAYLSTDGIGQLSSPVATFDEAKNTWQIPGIESRLREFLETGRFPDLAGTNAAEDPWPVTPADLSRIRELVV
jgi:predicted dehydrogenase